MKIKHNEVTGTITLIPDSTVEVLFTDRMADTIRIGGSIEVKPLNGTPIGWTVNTDKQPKD